MNTSNSIYDNLDEENTSGSQTNDGSSGTANNGKKCGKSV
jgi:hypothetical protein